MRWYDALGDKPSPQGHHLISINMLIHTHLQIRVREESADAHSDGEL